MVANQPLFSWKLALSCQRSGKEKNRWHLLMEFNSSTCQLDILFLLQLKETVDTIQTGSIITEYISTIKSQVQTFQVSEKFHQFNTIGLVGFIEK